jgi:hypothetical protein
VREIHELVSGEFGSAGRYVSSKAFHFRSIEDKRGWLLGFRRIFCFGAEAFLDRSIPRIPGIPVIPGVLAIQDIKYSLPSALFESSSL